MATTSQWTWDNQYQLYYNPQTRQWAKPPIEPDGEWVYSRRIDYSPSPPPSGQPPTLQDQTWENDGNQLAEEQEEDVDRYSNAPLLRLVVVESEGIPQPQRVAILDPSEPTTIGRDRSHERRIRIKHLSVSKSHATVYYHHRREEEEEEEGEEGVGYWAMVDNGSTHGTFIKEENHDDEIRLSKPKTASTKPMKLHPFDTLRCGTTIFTVHLHSKFSCSDCTLLSDSSNLIPLLPRTTTTTTTDEGTGGGMIGEIPEKYHTKSKEEKELERRKRIKGLKDHYLKSPPTSTSSSSSSSAKDKKDRLNTSSSNPQTHASSVSTSSSTTPTNAVHTSTTTKPSPFVDRAAARRARTIPEPIPSLPRTRTKNPPPSSPFFTVPGSSNTTTTTTTSSTITQSQLENDPFSSESKGAILLNKMMNGKNHGSTRRRDDDDGRSRGEGGVGVGNGGIEGKNSRTLGTLIEPKTFDSKTNTTTIRPGLGSQPLIEIGKLSSSSSGGGGGGVGGGREVAGGKRNDWREDVREASRKRFKEM